MARFVTKSPKDCEVPNIVNPIKASDICPKDGEKKRKKSKTVSPIKAHTQTHTDTYRHTQTHPSSTRPGGCAHVSRTFMYVCICVCVCICMYDVCITYTYVCTYVCMYMYICMYVYIHTYVRMFTYVYVCLRMYIHTCTYVYVYIHTYVCMYVCMYVCKHACMYVYMCICIHIRVHIYINTYTSMYVRIHMLRRVLLCPQTYAEHILVREHTSTSSCVRKRMHVCIFIMYACMHVHMYIDRPICTWIETYAYYRHIETYAGYRHTPRARALLPGGNAQVGYENVFSY
jgi:hypothetical protein